MPLEIYKVLHIFGILLLFSGLAGLWGVVSAAKVATGRQRALLSSVHGIGLLVVLISGFGMAGKLGLMAHPPGWLIVKILIWLALGGSLVLAKRKAQWGAALLIGWSLLGAIAAYMALLKPF